MAGYVTRSKVDETPAFQADAHGELPHSSIIQAIKESWQDMLRVIVIALDEHHRSSSSAP